MAEEKAKKDYRSIAVNPELHKRLQILKVTTDAPSMSALIESMFWDFVGKPERVKFHYVEQPRD